MFTFLSITPFSCFLPFNLKLLIYKIVRYCTLYGTFTYQTFICLILGSAKNSFFMKSLHFLLLNFQVRADLVKKAYLQKGHRVLAP